MRAAYWDYKMTQHTRNAILRGMGASWKTTGDREIEREIDPRLILVIAK